MYRKGWAKYKSELPRGGLGVLWWAAARVLRTQGPRWIRCPHHGAGAGAGNARAGGNLKVVYIRFFTPVLSQLQMPS